MLSWRFVRSISSSIPKCLEKRVAVVTASTNGIGLSIASRLARDGAKVMVSSRNQSNVDKAVESLQKQYGQDVISGVVCHVGNDDDRKQLIKQTVSAFGKIDILVSNAAVNPAINPIIETSESAWNKIFSVNVTAGALLVKEAYPYLLKTKNASVVLVSSFAGYAPLTNTFFLGSYGISKTALLAMTKVLAAELASDNIRVNCLSPGLVKTAFSKVLWTNEKAKNALIQSIPLRRFAEPDECAGIVSFLCSDDASYITGETVSVTGGVPCRL